jgi:3-hydroxypropanoate dehydrogenase
VSSAKERLKPLVFGNNQERVMTAPVTAILGYNTRFYDWLPRLFPTLTPAPGSSTSHILPR